MDMIYTNNKRRPKPPAKGKPTRNTPNQKHPNTANGLAPPNRNSLPSRLFLSVGLVCLPSPTYLPRLLIYVIMGYGKADVYVSLVLLTFIVCGGLAFELLRAVPELWGFVAGLIKRVTG